MRVAVVVVAHGAGEHLDRTLAALEQQTHKPARIIVVDNLGDMSQGLTPGHVELVKPERNLGFAAGNNVAVDMAVDCEWVALLNPDAFPEPRWLETLLDAVHARPEFSFFGSRLVMAGDAEKLDGTGDVFHTSGMAWRRDHGAPASRTRGEHEVFSPCAAAALYRRDAFLEAGGFDERFFCYYEDTDLAFRLRLLGHRCLHVDDAVVHHVGSVTAGRTSDFTVYHSFRNQVWAFAKNMPTPLLWLYLPQHLLLNGLQLLGYAAAGRPRVILRAKRDALRELPRVLRERRAIQRRRRVGARTIRRSLGRGPSVYAFAASRVRMLRA
jgi:GT2 family glycosyltransferase